jgi:hypothetical protein
MTCLNASRYARANLTSVAQSFSREYVTTSQPLVLYAVDLLDSVVRYLCDHYHIREVRTITGRRKVERVCFLAKRYKATA